MRSAIIVSLAVTSLLISAHKCPAPIQEVQETPTPSPSATPSTAPISPTNERIPAASPAATPSRKETRRIAGMWTGKIQFGNAGEVEFTLIVNPEATSLVQKSKIFGEFAHATIYSGGILSWTAGAKNDVAWTLTPNPDGKTAVATLKTRNNQPSSATFQRAEPGLKRNRGSARSKPHK